MRLIDLSQPLFHDCPNCASHPAVISELLLSHGQDDWQLEILHLSNHTGSHVDAPLHRVPGAASLDDLPLETFVGPAYIADCRGCTADQPITAAMLEETLPADRTDLKDRIVLLATGWGDRRARTEEWLHHSPFLSPEGAQWLVDRGVRGAGIDHYTIGGCEDAPNLLTHQILLGHGCWIVEELRFPEEVFSLPQPVQFWSLPINLQGHSGAFCRPVIAVG